MTMQRVPLENQIKEVERELALRSHVYPKWVKAGTMKQEKADSYTSAMWSALSTLKWVQAHEREIKAIFSKQPGETAIIAVTEESSP